MFRNGSTSILRTVAVSAALAIAPLSAMAGGADKSADKAKGMQQQSQAAEQSGAQVTLTEQEAEGWKLFPVVNANGEQIGQVDSVSLGDDGKIEELHIQTGQQLGIGEKTVTVEPDQFTTNGARVKLDLSNQEIQDLPEAQASQ